MRDTGNSDALLKAAESEGLTLRAVTLDVRRPETFDSFVSDILNDSGGIDVLVNNAGVLRAGTVEDTPEDTLRMVMETNFFGAMLLARAVLPQMRARRSGYIIQVSSLSGLAGLPGDYSYTASKFALLGLCQTMRNEGWEAGIRVTAICPGWVNTDMAAAVQAIPAEAMTQPQDIAALSAELLRLPNSAVPFELAINCSLER